MARWSKFLFIHRLYDIVGDILKPVIADGPPLFDLGINVACFLDPFLPVTTKWLKSVSSFSFKNSTSSLPLAFV
eukprot:snap_masked-scaffold_1-processed-gene-31.16-mRNA-1 protein AED:1.00 eAED:1.00 QI:0/0/0/0/1/1/2/0/73